MSYMVTGGSPEIVFSESDTVKSALQNIAVILATPKGSVPLFREFGLDMSFVDKPLPVARTLLVSSATEAVQIFEPRAEVRGVTFEIDEAIPGRLVPTVEVEIIG
jgi:phage baseplate assembly protein W